MQIQEVPQPYIAPEAIFRAFPEEVPKVSCMIAGRFLVLATAFRNIDFQEFLDLQPWKERSAHASFGKFASGYLGAIKYRDLRSESTALYPLSPLEGFVYRVEQALIFDLKARRLQVLERKAKGEMQWRINIPKLLQEANVSSGDPQAGIFNASETFLRSKDGDADYFEKFRRVQSDIRQGKYYQLNLLRFFEIEGSLPEAYIAKRLFTHGGPHSAWMQDHQTRTEIASFSPERFVKIIPTSAGIKIASAPIKGTARRSKDPFLDKKLADDLTMSLKDRAELSMIIDLMRNDLSSICQAGSVAVIDPGRLQSFSNVHHLVGEIHGELDSRLSVRDIFEALCPGGSISGAPKREVMRNISLLEGRSRDFFMGHAFALDDSGWLDSSILIRTLLKNPAYDRWQFAAGSGLTLMSKGDDEIIEITNKASILGLAIMEKLSV